MLVTSVITNNVQNDRFIANVLESAKHSSIQTIAYSIFAEAVPSALLFSAAISSVVDYYAGSNGKEKLEELIRLCTATTEGATNDALMKFIDEALGRFPATSPLTLEAYQKAAHGQDVSLISE